MIKAMNIEPYSPDVAAAGPNAPKCEQIDDLIRLLVTIRERFGNTSINYRVTWGGSSLWIEDEMRQKIAKLERKVARQKKQLAKG
jgi:hypothetical protein